MSETSVVTHPYRSKTRLEVVSEAVTMAAVATPLVQAVSLFANGHGQSWLPTVSMVAAMLLAYFLARMVGSRVEAGRLRRERLATYQRSQQLDSQIRRSFQPRL